MLSTGLLVLVSSLLVYLLQVMGSKAVLTSFPVGSSCNYIGQSQSYLHVAWKVGFKSNGTQELEKV